MNVRKRRAVVILVCAVLILGLGGWFGYRYLATKSKDAAEADAQPSVRTVQVRKGEISQTTLADGAVVASQRIDVPAAVAGAVEKVFVTPGAEVKKGDVLVKLDDSDLRLKVEEAEENLRTARLNLERLEADAKLQGLQMETQLKQAQANLVSAKAKLAELESGPKPQEVEQARSAVRQAQAGYDSAAKEAERMTVLYENKAISKQDWEAAQERATTAKEQLLTAEEKLELLLEGASQAELDSAKLQVQQAEAALAALMAEKSQSKSNDYDIEAARAQVRQAERALESAKSDLASATVTSPISGRVLSVSVQEGQTVSANTTVVSVGVLNPVAVEVYVHELDFASLKAGQAAKIRVDAYQDRVYDGVVAQVSEEGTTQDNVVSFKVDVTVPNDDYSLKPGMTAEVEFVIARKENALLVPTEAIRQMRGGSAVALVEGGETRFQPVETGISADGFTEILSGLEEGDMVQVAVKSSNGSSSTTGGWNASGRRFEGPGAGGMIPPMFDGGPR